MCSCAVKVKQAVSLVILGLGPLKCALIEAIIFFYIFFCFGLDVFKLIACSCSSYCLLYIRSWL